MELSYNDLDKINLIADHQTCYRCCMIWSQVIINHSWKKTVSDDGTQKICYRVECGLSDQYKTENPFCSYTLLDNMAGNQSNELFLLC